jgi:hypothetical protein
LQGRIADQLEWQRALFLVEVRGGGLSDLGCSHGSYGSAYVTTERLADIVENQESFFLLL